MIYVDLNQYFAKWRGEHAYRGTQYAVLPNGWMVTEVFLSWFDHFCETVKERPLLLVFDVHVSHLPSQFIDKAIENNITVLKLLPHTTDRLQPLNVCCFRPLKVKRDQRSQRTWNRQGTKWTKPGLWTSLARFGTQYLLCQTLCQHLKLQVFTQWKGASIQRLFLTLYSSGVTSHSLR